MYLLLVGLRLLLLFRFYLQPQPLRLLLPLLQSLPKTDQARPTKLPPTTYRYRYHYHHNDKFHWTGVLGGLLIT